VRQCDAEILGLPLDDSKYNVCCVPSLDAKFCINADIGEKERIKKKLAKGIPWEGRVGKFIRKYTKRGSVAVDAGSHIGVHTITMSRAVGPSGTVHSFEPQKKMCAEQWKNLELNSCNNVFLHRKAVGDRARKMQVGRPIPLHEGARTVVEFDAADTESGEEVDMVTLDSLGLENVSLIKADVEFYEYAVFVGARETIQRCRPVVLFEFLADYETPRDRDRVPEDIVENAMNTKKLIESYGYTLKKINAANYICFPTEKMAQIRKEAKRRIGARSRSGKKRVQKRR